jgi:hypothetical protein
MIIKKAKERMKGKAERKSTAKPSITELALMIIPLPIVLRVAVMLRS